MCYDEFSFMEKEYYIRDNFNYFYSPSNMAKIDNDENLTESQKEEMKNFLRCFGD